MELVLLDAAVAVDVKGGKHKGSGARVLEDAQEVAVREAVADGVLPERQPEVLRRVARALVRLGLRHVLELHTAAAGSTRLEARSTRRGPYGQREPPCVSPHA